MSMTELWNEMQAYLKVKFESEVSGASVFSIGDESIALIPATLPSQQTPIFSEWHCMPIQPRSLITA